MLSIEKRMTMLAIAAIGGSSFAAPAAMAGDVPGDGGNGGRTKCNASRGNGSEGCDPGRSSVASDGTAGQTKAETRAVR